LAIYQHQLFLYIYEDNYEDLCLMGTPFTIDTSYTKINWTNLATKPKVSAQNFVFFQPQNKPATAPEQTNNLAVKKAEELLSQDINEGNGKEMVITQGRFEQWCADTVNYIYEKAYGKTPFGLHKDGTYKSGVEELKKWGIANKRFKEAHGEAQIQAQLNEIKPGDVMILKSAYTVKTTDGKQITRHASHTGIIKEVKDGVVSVIEGNANIIKKNEKGEYYIVHNDKEGDNGAQAIGDFQEVNRYDGIILKKYSVKDFIDSGYSGYIDMQKIEAKK